MLFFLAQKSLESKTATTSAELRKCHIPLFVCFTDLVSAPLAKALIIETTGKETKIT